ncbi:sensor histidine kinase [Planctomicrobium piriforme]|uniref:histidine kinase n=1 Tax=Planctomicrobium piriforme TaxID=1576369 RepID=A0A1I3E7V1_9PLAN|nr:ATP-binding protein [Planctomicrobium piriforme]SFH95036.1 Signal transduction histidine kinase [Planctomicrobium piriforme]
MLRTDLFKISRTLRFRLAVVNSLVVVCISLVMLLAVRQGVLWALYQEVDQLLIEDLQEVTLAVQATESDDLHELQEELNRKALGHQQHGWYSKLFNANDGVIFATTSRPQLIVPFAPKTPGQPYTYEDLRIVEHRIPAGRNGIRGIRVGAKLASLYHGMAHIDRLVMVASAMLIIIAPLCGYWLAGRASQTVGEITRTAARLRPSHLNERLKLRGTDDELDRLSHTINGLLDRIAEYLQQRRDFLANAAHELRTPLAAIRSCIEVSLDGDRSVEDYTGILEDVIDQSASLEVLVNQLLLISETEIGQWTYDPEQVDLNKVVSRSVDMFQGVAETRSVTLSFDAKASAIVAGSRQHLRQVVNNLIDNAVKYSRPGGKIQVTTSAVPGEQKVRLTVQDTGIGIATEDVPRVFDRFFRSDRSRSRNESVQGTGLGLSICQSVISAHGGTILCHSELNVGTTIEIILPTWSEALRESGIVPMVPGHAS